MICKNREIIEITSYSDVDQKHVEKQVELNLDMSEIDFWHKLKDFDSYKRTKEEMTSYEDWYNWESSNDLILNDRYFTDAVCTHSKGKGGCSFFDWRPISYPNRPSRTLSIHGSKNVIVFNCYERQLFMHDFEGTLDNGNVLRLSISMSRAEWDEAFIHSGLVKPSLIQTRAQSNGVHKYFAGSFEITKYVNDMADKMWQEELGKEASPIKLPPIQKELKKEILPIKLPPIQSRVVAL